MVIVHLFVNYAHVNLCHFSLPPGNQGLAATSACDSFWTFLFTVLLPSTDLKNLPMTKILTTEN